jgi:hypothetical protein
VEELTVNIWLGALERHLVQIFLDEKRGKCESREFRKK